jgi:hypothetical protein
MDLHWSHDSSSHKGADVVSVKLDILQPPLADHSNTTNKLEWATMVFFAPTNQYLDWSSLELEKPQSLVWYWVQSSITWQLNALEPVRASYFFLSAMYAHEKHTPVHDLSAVFCGS